MEVLLELVLVILHVVHAACQLLQLPPEIFYASGVAPARKLLHRYLQVLEGVEALPPVQLPDAGVPYVHESAEVILDLLCSLEAGQKIPAGHLKVHPGPVRIMQKWGADGDLVDKEDKARPLRILIDHACQAQPVFIQALLQHLPLLHGHLLHQDTSGRGPSRVA